MACGVQLQELVSEGSTNPAYVADVPDADPSPRAHSSESDAGSPSRNEVCIDSLKESDVFPALILEIVHEGANHVGAGLALGDLGLSTGCIRFANGGSSVLSIAGGFLLGLVGGSAGLIAITGLWPDSPPSSRM